MKLPNKSGKDVDEIHITDEDNEEGTFLKKKLNS